MTCPDCEGVGFVVGELSGGRGRCLRCNATGTIAEPRRARWTLALEDLLDPDEKGSPGLTRAPEVLRVR
jgi:hypothetical protein